jgi:methionine-rich copper-binding protein CopC
MQSAAPSTAELTELTLACTSLWLSTLSLMTAFMQQRAPAHRYLLAQRIARNFATLRAQPECFSEDTLDKFEALERRWQLKAERLSPSRTQQPAGMLERLQRLFAR